MPINYFDESLFVWQLFFGTVDRRRLNKATCARKVCFWTKMEELEETRPHVHILQLFAHLYELDSRTSCKCLLLSEAGSRDSSSTRPSKPSKPSKVQGSNRAGRGAEGEEAFGFEASKPSKASKPSSSLLYPCFKTALCYGVVSGCFVHRVSPSSRFRPELAPERGPAAPGLAFRRPESACKVHAKSFGP